MQYDDDDEFIMRKMPLISVNLTTYNRSGYLLSRSIKSVLAQTHKNLEIIIVDDGSTDRTQHQVMQFQKNNQNIKFIKLKYNSGNAYARNIALNASNGDYIAFMDDDDEWIDNEKLEKQLKAFEINGIGKIGLIYTDVQVCTQGASCETRVLRKPKFLKRHILRGNGLIYSPTVLTKKEIIIEAGGFDTNLKRGVDSEFYRNIILNLDYDVFHLSEITTKIHIHDKKRMTSLNSLKSRFTHFGANIYIIRKYRKFYVTDPIALFERLFKAIKKIYALEHTTTLEKASC